MIKKILLGFGGLIVALLGYLGFSGSEFTVVSTEIEINAPKAQVWNVVANIDSWQDWSPVINNSTGQAKVGESVDITMIGPTDDQDGPQYSPTITELENEKKLRWRASMISGIVFTNDKLIELQETPNGTKVVHKEFFKGMMSAMMASKLDEGVKPILESYNRALKKKVESAAH